MTMAVAAVGIGIFRHIGVWQISFSDSRRSTNENIPIE